MFDKLKEMYELKRKADQIKKEMESEVFDVESGDIKVRINGVQKILKKIENNWGLVLKNAKSANSPLVPFLKEAKPIDLEDGLLTIEFAFPFHRQKAEDRKYRETIEEALEKITSLPIRFKGIVSKNSKEIKRLEPKEQREEVDPVEVFGKLE